MKLVQSLQGPFWVWESDHQGVIIGSNIYPQGWWDQHLKPFIDEIAGKRPGAWAIDVGASVGWFTCYFASRFANVVAVEALPQTFEILKRNIQIRGLQDRVFPILGVAYDQVLPFRLAPASMVGWPIPEDLTQLNAVSSLSFIRVWPGCECPGIRSQGLLLDHRIPWDADVALIKVDAQGCDLRALRGLKETITRCRPRVIFEFEGAAALWQGDTFDDYRAFFNYMGYKPPVSLRNDVVDWVADPR